jgi:hypothetical protein
MEGRSFEGVLLGDLQIDEEMWGPGSEPVVREWLARSYDPATMPTLVVVTIGGREGMWLLGWRNEGTEHRSLLSTIFGDDYALAQLDQAEALARDVDKRGVVCPRCGLNRFMPYEPGQVRQSNDPLPPALSRADNATHICSDCGTDEAMKDFAGEPLLGPDEWPLITPGSFGQGRL